MWNGVAPGRLLVACWEINSQVLIGCPRGTHLLHYCGWLSDSENHSLWFRKCPGGLLQACGPLGSLGAGWAAGSGWVSVVAFMRQLLSLGMQVSLCHPGEETLHPWALSVKVKHVLT